MTELLQQLDSLECSTPFITIVAVSFDTRGSRNLLCLGWEASSVVSAAQSRRYDRRGECAGAGASAAARGRHCAVTMPAISRLSLITTTTGVKINEQLTRKRTNSSGYKQSLVSQITVRISHFLSVFCARGPPRNRGELVYSHDVSTGEG